MILSQYLYTSKPALVPYAFTHDVMPPPILDHRINPALYNTIGPPSSKMTEEGPMYPYLDDTKRDFEQFLNYH